MVLFKPNVQTLFYDASCVSAKKKKLGTCKKYLTCWTWTRLLILKLYIVTGYFSLHICFVYENGLLTMESPLFPKNQYSYRICITITCTTAQVPWCLKSIYVLPFLPLSLTSVSMQSSSFKMMRSASFRISRGLFKSHTMTGLISSTLLKYLLRGSVVLPDISNLSGKFSHRKLSYVQWEN